MKSILHIFGPMALAAALLAPPVGAAAQVKAAATTPTRQVFIYPNNNGGLCRSDVGTAIVSNGQLTGFLVSEQDGVQTQTRTTITLSSKTIQGIELWTVDETLAPSQRLDSIDVENYKKDESNRSTGVSLGGLIGSQDDNTYTPIRYKFNSAADVSIIYGGHSEAWGEQNKKHQNVMNRWPLTTIQVYAGNLYMKDYQGKTLMVRLKVARDVQKSSPVTEQIDILFDPIGGYYSDVVRTEIDDTEGKWVVDEDEQAYIQAPCKDDKPEMKIKNSDNPYRDGETPLVSKLGNTYSAQFAWRLDRDTWQTSQAGQEKQQNSKSYTDEGFSDKTTSGERFYTPVMKFYVANNGGEAAAVPQCELSLDHQFQIYYFTALEVEGTFTNKTSNATKKTPDTPEVAETGTTPWEFTVCEGDEVEFTPSFKQSVVNSNGSGATEQTLSADVRWSLYEVHNDGDVEAETLVFKDRVWSQGGDGGSYSFGTLTDDKEYRLVAEYVDPDGHSQGALVADGKKDANDCPTEKRLKITVKKTNATSTITASDNVCEKSSVSLSASFTLQNGETDSNYAYRWQKSTDGATYANLPESQDWQTVNNTTTASATDANVSRPDGGKVWYKFQLGNKIEIDGQSYYCPAETVKEVTVNALPVLAVGGGDSSPLTLCEGQNKKLTLTLTAGYSEGDQVEFTLYEDESCKNEVNVNGLDPSFQAKQTVSASSASWTLQGAYLLTRGNSGTATLYAKAKNSTTSCESESLKVEVKLLPNPFVESLTVSPDKVCQGAEATVSATATISQTTYNQTKFQAADKTWPTNLTYHWDVGGTQSTSTATSAAAHTHQLTVPTGTASTQTVKVWVSDDNGCGYKYDAEGNRTGEPYTEAKSATVEVVEPPKFTVAEGVKACAADGNATVTLTSQDSKKISFTVTPKGGATATVAPTAVEPNQSADITISFGADQVSAVTTYSFDVTATHDEEPKCSETREFSITVYPNPRLTLTPAEGQRRVCAGSPIVLGAVATVPGLDNAAAANFTYKWTVDNAEQAGATGSEFTWTPGADAAGTSKNVSVEVSYAFDGGQSCKVSEHMSIEVLPLPAVTLAADPATVCEGEGSTLTATVTSEGAAQGADGAAQTFTYNITSTDGTTPAGVAGTDGKSWTFAVSPARTATYTLSVTNTSTGCVSAEATATVTVDIVDFALASDDGKAGDPMVYCVGDALNLRTAETLTGAYAYQWSKDGVAVENETASSFSIGSLQTTDGGTYSLRVTKDDRCSSERQIRIEVRQAPVPALTMTDAAGADVAPLEPEEDGKWKFKVCEDEAFTLTASGATTYTLTKVERGGQDVTDSFTPRAFTDGVLATSLAHVAGAADHTVYTLSVSFATGDCVEERTVEISVYDKPDAQFINGTPRRFVVRGEGVPVEVTTGFKKYSFYVGGVLKQEGESSTLAADQNVVDAEGSVEVRVVVENEAGCRQTITTTITALDGIVPRPVVASADYYCTDDPGVTISVTDPQPGLVYILDGIATAQAITSAEGQAVEWTGVRLTDPANQNPQTFKVRAYYAQLPDQAVEMANTVTVEEVTSPTAATMPTLSATDCATIAQTTWTVPTTTAGAYYFVKLGDDLFPAEGVQGNGGALTLQFYELAAAQYGAPRNGEYKVVARAKRIDGSFACDKELDGALTVDIPQTDAYALSLSPETDFCVGDQVNFTITLANSDYSADYEHVYVLRRNGEEVARQTSTAARGPLVFTDPDAQTLTAGEYIYTVVCLFSGCEMPMANSVEARLFSQPLKLDVTLENDGYYCPDDDGVLLTIAGAESGVTYALTDKRTRQVVQESVVWAGNELQFEDVTAGTYYIEAYIATVGNGCRTIFDDIVVTRLDEPADIVATISKVGQTGRGGQELTVCVDEEWQIHVAGADFQPDGVVQRSYALYNQENTLVSNEMQDVDQRNGTFSFPAQKAETPGTYTFSVMAKTTVTLQDGTQLECESEFEQVVTLTVKSRPKGNETVKTETPEGQTDPCYGVDVVIDNANTDAAATVEYRLYRATDGATQWNGLTPIATVRPYAGDQARFANIRDNGGTYAVVAGNGACDELIGTVTVSSDKFPRVQELEFEGFMCEGEPGKPVAMADTENGVTYTLYYISPDLYAQLQADGGLAAASLADNKPGVKLADGLTAAYDHQRLTFRGLKYSDDGVQTDLVNVDGYYYVVATKPAQEGQAEGCPVASPVVNFQTLKLPLSFNLEKSNIFCQEGGSTDVYVENAEYDPDGIITYSLYKVDDQGNATLFDQVRSNANTAGRLYFGRAVPEGDYYAIVFKQYGDQYGGHICSSRLRGDLRLRKAPALDLAMDDETLDYCAGDTDADTWAPDNDKLAEALAAGKAAQGALTGIRLFVTLAGDSPEQEGAVIAQALYDGSADVSFDNLPAGDMLVWASWASDDPADDLACLVNIGNLSITRRQAVPTGLDQVVCDGTLTLEGDYIVVGLTYQLVDDATSQAVATTTVDVDGVTTVRLSNLPRGSYTLYAGYDGGEKCRAEMGKVTVSGVGVTPIEVEMTVCDANGLTYEVPLSLLVEGANYHLSASGELPIDFAAEYYQYLGKTADGCLTVSGLRCGVNYLWMGFGESFECPQIVATITVNCQSTIDLQDANFSYTGGGCTGEPLALVLDRSQEGVGYYLTVGDDETAISGSEQDGTGEALTWAADVLTVREGTATYHLWAHLLNPTDDDCASTSPWKELTINFDEVVLPVGHLVAPDSIFEYCEGDLGVRLGYANSPRVGEIYRLYKRQTVDEENLWDRELIDMQEIPAYMKDNNPYAETDTLFFNGWGHNESSRQYATAGVYFVEVTDGDGCTRVTDDREVRELPLPVANDSVYAVVIDASGTLNAETASSDYGIFGYSIVVAGAKAGVSYSLVKDDTTVVKQIVPEADGDLIFGPLRDLRVDTILVDGERVPRQQMDVSGDTLYVGEGVYSVVVRDPETECDNTAGQVTIVAENLVAYNVQIFLGKSELGKTIDLIPAYDFATNISYKGNQQYIDWSSSIDRVYRPRVTETDDGYILDQTGTAAISADENPNYFSHGYSNVAGSFNATTGRFNSRDTDKAANVWFRLLSDSTGRKISGSYGLLDLTTQNALSDQTQTGYFSYIKQPSFYGQEQIRYQIENKQMPGRVSNIATITILAGNEDVGDDESVFLIPNAFSPNGDGLNDVFKIIIPDKYKTNSESKLQVFNRWGTLVYRSSGQQYGDDDNWWDGKSSTSNMVTLGQNLPSGTYYYVFTITFIDRRTVNRSTRKMSGYVELRR